MKRLFTGSDSEKMAFLKKVFFYLYTVGLGSIVAADVFKKELQPYKVILSIYLPMILVIWLIALIMFFSLSRKIRSN